jgi:hypothetical protein
VPAAWAGELKLSVGYCAGDTAPAKAAGFDYVEARVREFTALSHADFAEFAARNRNVGLPTPVAHWFLPADLKVAGPDVDRERVTTYLPLAFGRCEELGVRLIVFGSGDARRVPDGFSKDDAFGQLVDLGKRIAPDARKHGIVIVVEPLRFPGRAAADRLQRAHEHRSEDGRPCRRRAEGHCLRARGLRGRGRARSIAPADDIPYPARMASTGVRREARRAVDAAEL